MTQQDKDIAVLLAVSDEATARRVLKRARYRRLNERRAELIEADAPLSDPELSRLQDVTGYIVNLAFPRVPFCLDDIQAEVWQSIQQSEAEQAVRR